MGAMPTLAVGMTWLSLSNLVRFVTMIVAGLTRYLGKKVDHFP
jgi:hypothetical protein